MRRRDFLRKTALGFFSSGLITSLIHPRGYLQNQKRKIIFRTLGRTKLKIPIISFGVMNTDSPDLIKKALDMGINHLDTAHVYLRGNSETVIGKVLKERGERDKVYVATKMAFAKDKTNSIFIRTSDRGYPGATEENFFKQLEISLERLKSDYVDILYLHSCETPKMVTDEVLLNALLKAKSQGKTRFIGVSTHRDEANVIRQAVDSKVYDVVLTAYNFLQENRNEVKNAIAYAAEKGVGIIAMKTQGGRRLQEKTEVNHEAALKWVLRDENVCTAIPGMTTFEQLEMNFRVMENLNLSKEEESYLRDAALVRGKIYCQNCRSCIESCPKHTEIPTLMRVYMYAKAYENMIQAQLTLSEISEEYGLKSCRNCHWCQAICAQGIDINQRIRDLTANEALFS